MKKFLFCVSLASAGLMASCIEKNQEVDADSRPSWLGSSIYAELKNPTERGLLTGTFSNYLRLIDDLGYDEVLNRTGSKTVFPANDEAFARFFQKNDWGVTSYEQLSESQKKLLLYNSMLDNALLLGLLPNVSNGTNEPNKGQAVRHATNISIIDTVQWVPGSGNADVRPSGIPANNSNWTKFYEKGLYAVTDATRPMMVHLTREYMLNNAITTLGDESDFAILTGEPYSEGMAYIFNNKVEHGDITCQNGYIHQMHDVLVPPGNMAQVLRRKDNTSIFSRLVDYFAAPYYDENTTRNYNDWAMVNGRPTIDSIYQWRYLSNRSQGAVLTNTPDRKTLSPSEVLGFDPGWNQYFPRPAAGTDLDFGIMDMGACFAPSDDAMKRYFLPGGPGAYLIDIYGDKANTVENLLENLDSLQSKNPQVLTAFAKNLMKPSFIATVPSKFDAITNDASENMGVRLSLLNKKADGGYDITIANNGAIYVMNELIAPDEYQSVMAPASVFPDMKVINWMIQDRTPENPNAWNLGVDFRFYLLAMSANYALFLPEDGAFDLYYLDPASLGHLKNNQPGTQQAEVLHLYYDTKARTQPYLACSRHYYDLETGEIDSIFPGKVALSEVKSQLVDILNYHTVVLNTGEVIGGNHYYKTKHGGTVYVDGNMENGRVMSGLQIEDPDHFPAPRIKSIYNEKNGVAYRLDRVIQPPTQSVYNVLSNTVVGGDTIFADFLQACMGFGATEILEWAGISKVNPKDSKLPSPQDAYTIFTRDYKLGSTQREDACLDYNVKMFNTYNYTLFAPDNAAMAKAYAQGLPKWETIQNLFLKYHGEDAEQTIDEETGQVIVSDEEQADQAKAYLMIRALRDFVRYHFVTNSIYADNIIDGGKRQTLSSDDNGLAREVTISGGDGVINIADMHSDHNVSVNANGSTGLVNKMARDYWFTDSKTRAKGIETSSFCAVHQISEPLYGDAATRFDQPWASRSHFSRAMKAYQQKKANNEL